MTDATALERRDQSPALDTRDPLALGKVLAASGMFPDAMTEAKAAVKVLAGMELGFGSVAAMSGIHIIDGKPVLGANLLAAQVKRSPAYDYRVRQADRESCTLAFYQRARDGWEHVGDAAFTNADAAKAGLTGKRNWKTYPEDMLFARALTRGVRRFCPDLLGGSPVHVPDELDARVDDEIGEVVDDIPPAAIPAAVATSGDEPQAKPQQRVGKPISPAQKREVYRRLGEAGIKGTAEAKALKAWLAADAPLDRLDSDQAAHLIDGIPDHEAVLALIRDKAEAGDEKAKGIVERYLSPDGGDGDADGQQKLDAG